MSTQSTSLYHAIGGVAALSLALMFPSVASADGYGDHKTGKIVTGHTSPVCVTVQGYFYHNVYVNINDGYTTSAKTYDWTSSHGCRHTAGFGYDEHHYKHYVYAVGANMILRHWNGSNWYTCRGSQWQTSYNTWRAGARVDWQRGAPPCGKGWYNGWMMGRMKHKSGSTWVGSGQYTTGNHYWN